MTSLAVEADRPALGFSERVAFALATALERRQRWVSPARLHAAIGDPVPA